MELALKEMEKDLDLLKVTVDTSKALERLERNKDFKKLFLDIYTTKHVLTLVRRKALLENQGELAQKDLDNQLMAVSFFLQYVDDIREMGNQAKMRTQNIEVERDRLLEEGDEYDD